jgi:hypothetical protein
MQIYSNWGHILGNWTFFNRSKVVSIQKYRFITVVMSVRSHHGRKLPGYIYIYIYIYKAYENVCALHKRKSVKRLYTTFLLDNLHCCLLHSSVGCFPNSLFLNRCAATFWIQTRFNIAHSVQWLAMVTTIGVWFPAGAELYSSPARSDRPCGSPGLIFGGYRGPFTGIKRPELEADHPPPSSTEVKIRGSKVAVRVVGTPSYSPVPNSNLAPKTGCHDWDSLWFSSVPPE